VGDGLACNSSLNPLQQAFQCWPFEVGDKIEILGKPPAVVTPAEGRAALENQTGAFRTSVDTLENDELEKLRAADVSFGIGFHTFSL
jgi:hypothetical protein